MEPDRDDFAIDIRICNKSAFMMLSFQDRIIKLRNYFKKEEYLFLGMSREKKNLTSEDLQNSSASTKKTILQYLRK